MNNIFKGLITICLFYFPLAVNAQTGEGLGGEFDIVRPYQPRLTDVTKLPVNPQDEREEAQAPELVYNNQPIAYNLQVNVPDIRPMDIGRIRLQEIHKYYAKVGAGNYASLFADVYVNTLRSRDNLLAARVKHYSGKGPVDNSNFSENLIGAYGKKNFNRQILTGEIAYSNNRHHFYGYDHEIIKDTVRRNLRQTFNHFNLLSSFNNEKAPEGRLNYWFDGGYHFFADRYASHEHNPFLKIRLQEYHNNNVIGIQGGVEYSGFRFDTLITNHRTLFRAGASYKLNNPAWSLKAGFNTATEKIGDSSAFRFYPDITIEANVAEEFLILYGGIVGDKYFNTYRDFAVANPFLVSGVDIRSTNKGFELYGGAKGTLSNKAAFLTRVSYQNLSNLPFFVNDSTDTARFHIIYDEGNVNLFNLRAEFMFDLRQNLKAGLSTDINKYSLSTIEEPWHRPSFTAGLHARYNLENKIGLTTDIFAVGKRKATTLGAEEIRTLPGYIDLNAGVSYKFSETFTAFIDFKNILNKKYDLYNHYPARGFNLLGGVKVNL